MSFKAIELSVRKRLPRWARQTLRLLRFLSRRPVLSAPLPPALFEDCRVAASRYELVARLPGDCVAEIGVYRGEFSRHVLKACSPTELVLVDLDLSLVPADVREDPRVRLMAGASHEILTGFPESRFDWIYIDADHSYEGCLRDARAAASKVKPGGHLVFNDFAQIDPELGLYGVHRAVVEFALETGWPFAWLAYEPAALYDVALRRPH